jgi:hypothetical protein
MPIDADFETLDLANGQQRPDFRLLHQRIDEVGVNHHDLINGAL